ncbi:hypothetical protein SAMN04489712_11381 [Thermomonospora echinospora]|uniref:Uncharacterized protein n=1 Tax=Thermomonospora echinospora TaxID=1992 RepID=A0A1H6D548_9ACTN|nr:hypothetical protein [Thermomonospora echinospora]SEG80440.1 hypothetical protein SAMN04489712_11381 [Thermomonospora echinospora]
MAVTETRRVAHRTLDGSLITLTGALDLSRPYSSIMRLNFVKRLHELTGVERRFGEDWARSLGVRRLTEEFRLQGGRLRVGEALVRDESLRDFPAHHRRRAADRVMAAVWEGRRHSVCAHFYHAEPADAIRLFDALRITEHPEGIALAPKRGGGAAVAETASVAKDVPGVGLLEITPLNRETARRLPGRRGTRLPTGELFRDTHEDGGVYFVMATPTALVTVLPDDQEVRRAPARLGALSVRAAG